jgi:hypothetical protein
LTTARGVAINARGEISVSDNSIFPEIGEVLKIR